MSINADKFMPMVMYITTGGYYMIRNVVLSLCC